MNLYKQSPTSDPVDQLVDPKVTQQTDVVARLIQMDDTG